MPRLELTEDLKLCEERGKAVMLTTECPMSGVLRSVRVCEVLSKVLTW